MTFVCNAERGGIGGTGTAMVGIGRLWRGLLVVVGLSLLVNEASSAELPELPADAVVHSALEQHPMVRAARAGLDVGAARRDQLVAGTHEFEVTVGGARRRETATGVSLNEKEFGLQRALRLPNKGSTDEKLGDEVMNHAESSYGDALHETGRQLLASWFAAKREALAVATGDTLVTTWEEQVRVTRRRVEQGDAAALDRSLTEAQLAQAEAQRAAARNRLRNANDTLHQHFPGLPLPTAVSLPEPPLPEAQEEKWLDLIRQHNHELAVARSEARQGRIVAERADQDRIPDPKLGLRWASERDGQEKLLGLQLTIPLPGSGRAAVSRGASAEAAAADAREAAVLAKVEMEARRVLLQVDSSYRQWRSLEDVAQRMQANAALLDKAWRLGEGTLNDLINARRLAGEASLAASQARADAHEAYYRLRLDAHVFWAFDSDHDEVHDVPRPAQDQ